MPVEDIDFLYQNSVKESIIVLVDSSKRNKSIYPKPAEFQIDFHEPFTFVYGIDILNTTIPRTAFMIDSNNNELFFKEAVNLNQNGIETRRVTFTLQDFPSAEVFYQRMNEQFEYYTESLQIDNYENLFDNSLYEQRAKSDYPIIRAVNTKPFFLDMKKSTIKTIFGFDMYPDKTDFSKYLTFGEILNSYVGVNNIDHAYDTPHESSSMIPYYTRDVTAALETSSSLQTVRFRYTHSSEHSIGAYMQSITIHSNKTFTNDTENITITVRNITKNVTLLEEYQNIFFNSFVTTESDGLTAALDNFLLLNTKTQLLLTNGDQYDITIRNVYVEPMYNGTQQEIPFSMHIRMNYIYFANVHNLPLDNDTVFVAKPIYHPIDGNLALSLVNDPLNAKRVLLTFDTIQNQILSALSVYNIGSIYRMSLSIQVDSSLGPTDVFVLRMTKNTDNVREHVCEFVMSLRIDSANNYTLVFENDKLDRNILSHVNMDISQDYTSPNYFLNVTYEFDLFSSKTVVLETADPSHTVEYQFFKEFSLIAPGMLNLASENYLVLRCDEIENHLRGSHDIKDFSPGLGVLNIDVQGYASDRTEFFSVKYKEFHPIGKLSKMKFRFERKSDGKLYDFRNIDLHFLMSIKYLKPVQKQSFEHSVLNPNYNPNYLGYFNKTLHDLYDEESSDDDSDIDEAYFESEFNDRENELVHRMRRTNKF